MTAGWFAESPTTPRLDVSAITQQSAVGGGHAASRKLEFRRNNMSTITVKDGTTIYYKDWGNGPVVTFSHGWPLCSDAWDGQMLFLSQNGFRVVAHDRRGHGRSSQASSGNDMNGSPDHLAATIQTLNLTQAPLLRHSPP